MHGKVGYPGAFEDPIRIYCCFAKLIRRIRSGSVSNQAAGKLARSIDGRQPIACGQFNDKIVIQIRHGTVCDDQTPIGPSGKCIHRSRNVICVVHTKCCELHFERRGRGLGCIQEASIARKLGIQNEADLFRLRRDFFEQAQ